MQTLRLDHDVSGIAVQHVKTPTSFPREHCISSQPCWSPHLWLQVSWVGRPVKHSNITVSESLGSGFGTVGRHQVLLERNSASPQRQITDSGSVTLAFKQLQFHPRRALLRIRCIFVFLWLKKPSVVLTDRFCSHETGMRFLHCWDSLNAWSNFLWTCKFHNILYCDLIIKLCGSFFFLIPSAKYKWRMLMKVLSLNKWRRLVIPFFFHVMWVKNPPTTAKTKVRHIVHSIAMFDYGLIMSTEFCRSNEKH